MSPRLLVGLLAVSLMASAYALAAFYDAVGEHVWWIAVVVLSGLGVAYWKTRR